MVVNLPGGKKLAIDSKVSLNAYLEAVDAEDETLRDTALLKHADEIWSHVTQLGRKDYAAALRKEGSLDFVIMFVPKESFFAAAMESRPTLIEDALDKKVLIASPANLIAILKSVALVWRQEKATENAEAVARMAKDLYDSLQTMSGHLGSLGKSLETLRQELQQGAGKLRRPCPQPGAQILRIRITGHRDRHSRTGTG